MIYLIFPAFLCGPYFLASNLEPSVINSNVQVCLEPSLEETGVYINLTIHHKDIASFKDKVMPGRLQGHVIVAWLPFHLLIDD